MADNTKDTFNEKMKTMILGAHAISGVSIGCKLGLFQTMVDIAEPFTAQQLATTAKCKERYIREWLHMMVVCNIIDVDETGMTFTFPEYRHEALTSQGQLVPDLAAPFPYLFIPHDELLECFKEDGPHGISYSKVNRVSEEYYLLPGFIPNQLSCADYMVSRVPGMKEKLEQGISLCDVASGSGVILNYLANKYRNSKFVGFDLDQHRLQKANASATNDTLTNVQHIEQDACTLSEKWTSAFNYVYIREALHDITLASTCLKEIHKCLKPDGRLVVFEYYASSNIYKTHQDPMMKLVAQVIYPSSLYHCLPSAMHTQPSDGLGTVPGIETLTKLLQEAGFEVEECKQMPDSFFMVFVCKKA